ncbi:MAG: AAA family ATPase [Acidobacteriaceae bacterium]|nr:AAA family ATPase [Acidobacteriaceae bacterium]
MPLTHLHVSGYRSVRDLNLPLGQVNVITGANGTGKSNLYGALMLVARAAEGQFARAIGEEGGIPSVLWAGGERIRYTRKQPVKRFCLGIQTDSFGFSFAVGLPSPSSLPPGRSLFGSDPEVKEEKLTLRASTKSVLMLDRRGPTAWLRNAEGRMDEYAFALLKYESVLPQIVDPHRYPEIHLARQTILSWRFYHQFRTDANSPLRYPQIGVQTCTLGQDGADLAAALETIIEIGDENGLAKTIAHAFRGARLRIEASGTLFSIYLEIPGLLRPLHAREFSDGQLRFLCLCAALLSPRPPSLIALNEPETSLHPDLYEPLAQLIARASHASQIWVTTHARPLAEKIAERSNTSPVELTLIEGETWRTGDPNTPRRPYQKLHFGDEDKTE